ncbi:DUF167 domain-containing protein [Chlorobium sp. N1]|uniref:DUF167 domain-containing protein n=1 Tax=Chlorobium sp. N1 TaxID=2491138 RepID=UPI00103D39D0|nr:DUF167 domain-containing protein [Chlorobium sp. N1]TCD47915.1 DUF167 domain-containing protein [Chlorobium sp. N1]
MVELREKKGSALLGVRVQPRSSKSAVSGPYGGMLKVSLKSAPVDDAANRECCRLLSKLFSISRERVSIVSGATSRSKSVMLEGLSVDEARHILRNSSIPVL